MSLPPNIKLYQLLKERGIVEMKADGAWGFTKSGRPEGQFRRHSVSNLLNMHPGELIQGFQKLSLKTWIASAEEAKIATKQEILDSLNLKEI